MRSLEAVRWWVVVVPLLAVAAWWPVGCYWASDDFIAVEYASQLSRAAGDLVGPQYSATDVWLFYRPFITLSFWLDGVIGGSGPFVSHLSNVLAHGVSALLLVLVWRRFASDASAVMAGVLWALMPGHVGSVSWAVGRVDSHTVVWCVMAVWLCLRANEARAQGVGGARWPMVLAVAFGLCSKELAFVLPPLLSWLSWLQSDRRGVERFEEAWRASWPAWVLFAGYMALRMIVLGRFGGYTASSFELGPSLSGLWQIVCDLLVPLRWIGAPAEGGAVPEWLWLFGATAPVVVAVLLAFVSRPQRALASLATFAFTLVPMYAFFSSAHNHHNLRYYYLPTMALIGLVACAGRWVALAVMLAWALPFVAVRSVQLEANRECAEMHGALLEEVTRGAVGPMFVAGMPHGNAAGTAVQLHFGIDRMLVAPFSERDVQLYAWRPLAELPGVFRLTPQGEPPFALPQGSTWWFADATALGRAPVGTRLPELQVGGDVDGVLDLGSERLGQMADAYEKATANDSPTFGLTTPGVNPIAYRVTLFTANGYLSCVCANHARQGPDGRIDMLRFFSGDENHPIAELRMPASLNNNLSPPFIGDALVVPTTIDLVPEFPTLIEAGVVDIAKQQFVPTHRARRMVTFRFDRDYPSWVRRVQGTSD